MRDKCIVPLYSPQQLVWIEFAVLVGQLQDTNKSCKNSLNKGWRSLVSKFSVGGPAHKVESADTRPGRQESPGPSVRLWRKECLLMANNSAASLSRLSSTARTDVRPWVRCSALSGIARVMHSPAGPDSAARWSETSGQRSGPNVCPATHVRRHLRDHSSSRHGPYTCDVRPALGLHWP